MNNELQTTVVYGEKGKGASGGGAKEAPNTLRSASSIKIVEVISEGPIEGLIGGAKGIYINDTPLQNVDDTYNFDRVLWDYRVGLPSQDYMQGFAAAEAEVVVGSDVTFSTPVVRTVSSANVDAARVTVQLPQGLSKLNTTNGNLNGSNVSFRIDKKLTSSGTWITDGTYTITGKAVTPYEAAYRVERPAGSGTWDIRLTRLTVDPPDSSTRNLINWARYTEIQDVKLPYNDTAYVGIQLDAESVGNSVPKRSYLVKGLKVSIPSNYNPTTRVYTGDWDGTFTSAWTDNPAWVLYDLLTNDRYGLGEYIAESQIDKYSFYNAAVYNDELVDDGNGGTEPRFTFNTRIAAQEDAFKIIQAVAGSFRANLVLVNGLYTLIQDRPSDPVKLINKANVIDGKFKYKSSGLFERHTAFNVTWNDRTDRHLQRVSTVEDTAGIARYGYFPLDITAYGATTEGQAIRAGRWALDTELNQTEQVEFAMSINGFDLAPGDIITVYDEDYTDRVGAGRVVSVANTTVTLDRAVYLTPNSSIQVVLSDGSTLQSKAITETSGNLSVVTVSSAFANTVTPGAEFIVTTTVSPRQFRVMNIRQNDLNTITVEAVYHDPGKYARVETGYTLPSLVFSNSVFTVVQPPANVNFSENSVVLPSGVASRQLQVTWDPPTNNVNISGYTLKYRYENENLVVLPPVTSTNAAIPADRDGVYTVFVVSNDYRGGFSGTAASNSYSFTSNTATLNSSSFGAVQNLYTAGTTNTSWDTFDLVVTWNDNPSNLYPAQDYKVEVLTTSDVVRLSTVTKEKRFSYFYDQNRNFGGPDGTLKVRVTARDPSGRYANATTATFTNNPPAAIANLSISSSYNENRLRWDPNTEKDLANYVVWASTSNGFTPSVTNRVFVGRTNEFTHSNLTPGTTYYYRVAAADVFNANPVNGTGLNVSAQISSVPLSPANDNGYRVEGVLWNPNSPSVNQVTWSNCTIVKVSGTNAGNTWNVSGNTATWTSGILYVYYTEGNNQFQTTTTLANAIAQNKIIVATYRGGTNLQIGNGNSYLDGSLIIAGTVAAAQLTTGTAVITQAAQIQNGIIENAKIQDAAITTAKIANLSVTTLKLANQSVTIPVGAAGSDVVLTSNTGSIELCSAAIAVDSFGVGGGIVIVASVYGTLFRGDNTIGQGILRLKRNGTTIKSVDYYSVPAIESERTTKSGTITTSRHIKTTVFNFIDPVTVSNTYTYTLEAECYRTSGAGSVSFTLKEPGIMLLAAKK